MIQSLTPGGLRGWLRRIPWEYGVVMLLWVYIFPYSTGLNNPNERTRVWQARALAQHGHLHIVDVTRNKRGYLRYKDIYNNTHGASPINDVGIACDNPKEKPPRCAGKIYPAKAPGVALVGYPALKLARAAGWVPDGYKYESRATWVLRYGGVALWMLLALMAMSQLLHEGGVPRPLRARIVVATAVGTSLFPYSISFVGHALAGGMIVIGLYFLNKGRASGGFWGFLLAMLGGHFIAWSELMEYHAVVAILVISAWVVLSKDRWKMIPGYALGSGAGLALFMWLHKIMFHHPLRTGHFALVTDHNRHYQAKGFLGINGFYWEAIGANLFDPYMGLFFLMPWLLVGLLVGWFLLPRYKQGDLPLGLTRTIAFIPLAYLLFVAMLEPWKAMNGWSYGPRYLTPTMLCMALTAGFVWHTLYRRHPKLHRLFVGLVLVSIVITCAVTMVFPSPPDRLRNPLSEMAVPLLSKGWSSRNILMFLGPASLAIFGVLVVAVCVWLGNHRHVNMPGRRKRWSVGLLRWSGIFLMVAWLAGMSSVKILDKHWQTRVIEYCQRVMEGIAPMEENPFFDDQKK
ncbi:MAG: hypothetical protein EP343_33535 [Deltaproteobacteria bacterium]|nr:MAG: hypothetical protein EP343_33535 [Deltaproteobacteria bacterium]